MLEKLKERAKDLKRQLTVMYYAQLDPRLPALARLPVAGALLYALSPIDLIPDFIPVLGYLDDLVILPALIALAIRLIPPEILDRARARSEAEPIRLGKRWPAAVIFILLWAGVLFLALRPLFHLFGRN